MIFKELGTNRTLMEGIPARAKQSDDRSILGRSSHAIKTSISQPLI
jgi:hypothetical protein